MELGLGGHTALITGGASGIGLATAHGFCQEGCSVILWDNSPRVEAVALELATLYGIEVKWKVVDVVEFESVRVAAESDFNRSQRLEHVVHCAAIGSSKFGFPFTNLKPDDWNRTLEVNIMGMVNVAHVFLASVAGQMGSQTDPPYSASKAANINFAQCMAKDLAGHGIRVNSVCPGMVKTPLNRSVWQSWNEQTAESERISYEQWAERKIRSVVPLGRWQTPEDIASMIVFLSSERASNVTGQTINVDGGFVMHC
jgi:NAD(P)-dependent dehydrogenase (short-subunit alcohol dehydrogenase family)